MKKPLQFVFIIVISLTLTTCQKDHMLDCFKSAGDETTEWRDAIDISTIQLDNNVDLIIHPNSTPYIKVTAGENLIDGIITELSGNTLYIRNENRCNWMRSFSNTYTVEVGMTNPEHIVYYGSGNINCIDTISPEQLVFDGTNGSGSINLLLDCERCYINNHTGRTDIHLKGKCNSTNIYVNDVGTLDATELNSLYSYVKNKSTGDIKLKVQDELGVEILYNGNVYYSGSPNITTKLITGKGELIPF